MLTQQKTTWSKHTSLPNKDCSRGCAIVLQLVTALCDCTAAGYGVSWTAVAFAAGSLVEKLTNILVNEDGDDSCDVAMDDDSEAKGDNASNIRWRNISIRFKAVVVVMTAVYVRKNSLLWQRFTYEIIVVQEMVMTLCLSRHLTSHAFRACDRWRVTSLRSLYLQRRHLRPNYKWGWQNVDEIHGEK